MVRFKDVATKNLASYLGWRRMIERDGDAFQPKRCIVNAWPCMQLKDGTEPD